MTDITYEPLGKPVRYHVPRVACVKCGHVLRLVLSDATRVHVELCKCDPADYWDIPRDTILVGCIRCGARAPTRQDTDLSTFSCTCGGDVVPVAGPVQERAT